MAKSKTVTRVAMVQPRSGAATRVAPARVVPMGIISLPEFAAFVALCLTLVAAPYGLSGFWMASLDGFGGDAYQPLATLLGVTACVCLLLAVRNYQATAVSAPGRLSPLAITLVAFFAWCCVAAMTAVYLHDALLELARVGGCLIWFGVARTLLEPPGSAEATATASFQQRRFWLLHGIVAGALLVCGIGVAGFVDAMRHHEDPRQFSTFFNPNLFANFCAMALPLTLAWAVMLVRAVKDGWLRLPPALAAALAFALPATVLLGLLVSGSKGGLLAVVAGLGVFAAAVWRARGARIQALLRAHYKTVAVVAALVVLGGGAVMARSVLPRLLAALSTEDHSTMFRYYTWQGTLHMIAARPVLGWGPGNFPWGYPPFEITHNVMTAHEVWLQIAAENGVPALLLFAAALVVAALRAWRALRTDDWPVAAGGLGVLAAFTIHGLTDSGWTITSIALLLLVTLALLDTAPPTQSSTLHVVTATTPTRSSLSWPWVAASLVVALAAGGLQRAISSEYANFDARAASKKGAYTVGLPPAREATETDPLNARAWLNLARMQDVSGEDAEPAFARAAALQPTRASNWANWAAAMARKNDAARARQYFERAVAVDPNATGIRLMRAQWLLSQPGAGDQALGWRDLEHIAWLATQPYGRFPATPEFVNLDFARAYVKLAQRDLRQGRKSAAKALVERGLADVARARHNEDYQRKLAQEGGLSNIGPAEDLDVLQNTLQGLKERTR